MNTYLISSMMAITAGFIIGTYKEFAKPRGWPIGKFYFKYSGWIALISLGTIIPGSIELFQVTDWYYALLLIAVSFFLAGCLTIMLKDKIQWIAFFILIASFLIFTIGGTQIVYLN